MNETQKLHAKGILLAYCSKCNQIKPIKILIDCFITPWIDITVICLECKQTLCHEKQRHIIRKENREISMPVGTSLKLDFK